MRVNINEIERWFSLSEKWEKRTLLPDEQERYNALRDKVVEEAGVDSDSCGYLVLSNYKWIYAGYCQGADLNKVEYSDELEERIWWDSIAFVENWVVRNANKELRNGSQREGLNYYRVLSEYLATSRLPGLVRGVPGWNNEVIAAKWGLLRRELKLHVQGLIEGVSGDEAGFLSGSLESRIEPLFNKLLLELNVSAKNGSISTEDSIKLFNKLSVLLAEIKGEKKPKEESQVTHNNVFAVILNNKEARGLVAAEIIDAKAREILMDEDYLLE